MPTPSLISIKRRRVVLSCALAFAFIAAALSSASADVSPPPTPEQRTLAAAYFEQGRALMGEGKYAEACPKLEESQRLDPGGGTLLNIALCHERIGKLATAWVEFRQARAMARADKRSDRESAADAEITKLEPLLSKVSIQVPPDSAVPGLRVTLDGANIAPAGWGTPFPIDPGAHVVAAEAPGYAEHRATIDIGPTASEKTVTIPRLVGAPPGPVATATASASSAPPLATAGPSSGQRLAGFVVGGVGLAGIAVGAGFGAGALAKQSASNDICPGETCTEDQAGAIPLNRDARTFALISDIAFGVGAAGAIAGVILVLTAPSTAASRGASLGFVVDGAGGRATVRGTF